MHTADSFKILILFSLLIIISCVKAGDPKPPAPSPYPYKFVHFGINDGQAGLGPDAASFIPYPKPARLVDNFIKNYGGIPRNISDVGVGASFTVMLDTEGDAWVFGSNPKSSLGFGCSMKEILEPARLNITDNLGLRVRIEKIFVDISTIFLKTVNRNEIYVIGDFIDFEEASITSPYSTTPRCFPELLKTNLITDPTERIDSFWGDRSSVFAITNKAKTWVMGSVKQSLESPYMTIMNSFELYNMSMYQIDTANGEIVTSALVFSKDVVFLTNLGRVFIFNQAHVPSATDVVEPLLPISLYENPQQAHTNFTEIFIQSMTTAGDSHLLKGTNTVTGKTQYFLLGTKFSKPDGGSTMEGLETLFTPLNLDLSTAMIWHFSAESDIPNPASLQLLRVFAGHGLFFVFEKGCVLYMGGNSKSELGLNTVRGSWRLYPYLYGQRVPNGWYNGENVENIKKIGLSGGFSIFLMDSAKVLASGDSTGLQLGVENPYNPKKDFGYKIIDQYTPHSVSWLRKYFKWSNYTINEFSFDNVKEKLKYMDVEGENSLMLYESGRTFVWGLNAYHQLGLKHNEVVSYPAEIPWFYYLQPGELIIQAELSGSAGFALSNLGSLYYWGSSCSVTSCELSNMVVKPFPTLVPDSWIMDKLATCRFDTDLKLQRIVNSGSQVQLYFEKGYVFMVATSSFFSNFEFSVPICATSSPVPVKDVFPYSAIFHYYLTTTGSLYKKDPFGPAVLVSNDVAAFSINPKTPRQWTAVKDNGAFMGTVLFANFFTYMKKPLEIATNVLIFDDSSYLITNRGRGMALGKNDIGQLGIGELSVNEPKLQLMTTPTNYLMTNNMRLSKYGGIVVMQQQAADYWEYWSWFDKNYKPGNSGPLIDWAILNLYYILLGMFGVSGTLVIVFCFIFSILLCILIGLCVISTGFAVSCVFCFGASICSNCCCCSMIASNAADTMDGLSKMEEFDEAFLNGGNMVFPGADVTFGAENNNQNVADNYEDEDYEALGLKDPLANTKKKGIKPESAVQAKGKKFGGLTAAEANLMGVGGMAEALEPLTSRSITPNAEKNENNSKNNLLETNNINAASSNNLNNNNSFRSSNSSTNSKGKAEDAEETTMITQKAVLQRPQSSNNKFHEFASSSSMISPDATRAIVVSPFRKEADDESDDDKNNNNNSQPSSLSSKSGDIVPNPISMKFQMPAADLI